MNELLSVRGLTKNFDRFSLQELSFSLPEGCITGFIGANGAGKTTTLRTILDLIHKDSGDVRIFGLDMSTDARAIKDRIGVVLDDGGFYDELSLGEMKRIIAPAYSRWSDEDFQRWLDHFRLDPHQKIATLSRGMRMKFALALAMSHGSSWMSRRVASIPRSVASCCAPSAHLWRTAAKAYSSRPTSPPISTRSQIFSS